MCTWALLLQLALLLAAAAPSDSSDPPPGMRKISFKPPALDEEEQESMVIPPVYRCDACAAVAYQIQLGFYRAELKKQGHTRKSLRQMEVLDAAEKFCGKGGKDDDSVFDDYGIKGISDPTDGYKAGDKILNGAGLPKADAMAGVIQGGGKWPGRLALLCQAIMGEVGEDEIYQQYRHLEQKQVDDKKHAGLYQSLCMEMEACDGKSCCSASHQNTAKKSKQPSTKKQKKKKKKKKKKKTTTTKKKAKGP